MERKTLELLHGAEESWWYRGRSRVIETLLRRAGIHARSALDFGAGFGALRGLLAQFAVSVYAFEPDAAASAVARGRGYAQVFASADDALAENYELVCLFDVLEHIEDDRAFLRRLYQAILPGGHIIITVPAYQWLWSVHDVNNHHFRRYTRRSLVSALESCGYDITYASYWNMTLLLPAALVRVLGLTGESTISGTSVLDPVFLAIVRVESFLMRYVSLPFGTSVIVVASRT